LSVPTNVLPVSSIPAASIIPPMARAEATSEEQMMRLPFPRRVDFAIAFASRSTWNIKPLNFSTDQRPLESTSRSNTPAVDVLCCAPCSALK